MEKVDENRENDSDDESLTIDSDDELVDDSTEGSVTSETHRLWPVVTSARKEQVLPNFTGISNCSSYGGPEADDALGINMENRNTQRKTDTDIRILIAYLRSLNDSRPPETIPPIELDRYLSNFFTIVKKHDGNDYEPASLRGMLCSVERYLKMKCYQASVTRDIVFVNTRHALKYKQQRLRELGKGSKKTNEPFGKVTLEKVNQLFMAHEMGPYTPMSIINSMCFMFIVHFRLRKAIDHKNLVWGDIKLRADQSGKEYILYEPLVSRGQLDGTNSTSTTQPTTASTTNAMNATKPEQSRTSYMKLCIWAQPEVPERDPVGIYKLYSQKRPPNMQHDNSPFYLGITTLHPSPVQAWYRTCAMGVNKLSDLVRMIRDITGLPRAALNPPAESLLSESYTTHLPSSSGTSYNTTNCSSPEADRDIYMPSHFHNSNRESPQIETNTSIYNTHIEDRVKEEPSESGQPLVTTRIDALSRGEGQNAKLQQIQLPATHSAEHNWSNSTYSDVRSTPDTPQPTVSTHDNSASLDDPVMAGIEGEQTKFREMLQTIDPESLEIFGAWLKRIRIFRNQQTGEIQCEEDDTSTTKPNNNDVKRADVTQSSITLNITLSPGAMSGEGPVTVTASTVNRKCPPVVTPPQKSTNIKTNVVEPLDITNTPRPTGPGTINTTNQPPIAEKTTWPCPSNKRKRYASSDSVNGPPGKLNRQCFTTGSRSAYAGVSDSGETGTSLQGHQPDNFLSNRNSDVGGAVTQTNESITNSNPMNMSATDSPRRSPSISPGDTHTTSHTVTRSMVENTISVVQPCLTTSGLSTSAVQMPTPSIPQAHTSVSQRLGCNTGARDLSMFLPMPLPYPGQIPTIMANRMLHNPAMLASFANSHMPVSAHAGYLPHSSLYNSINRGDSTVTNTSTATSDSID